MLAERSPAQRTATAAGAAGVPASSRDPAGDNAPAGRSSAEAAAPATPAPSLQRCSECHGAVPICLSSTPSMFCFSSLEQDDTAALSCLELAQLQCTAEQANVQLLLPSVLVMSVHTASLLSSIYTWAAAQAIAVLDDGRCC